MADQFCTFHIDEYFFGIEVRKVQEVLRYQEMTQVPLTPPVVAGLINLRGQIVTAIDLRRRLGFDEPRGESQSMNVIVNIDGSVVSFLVDEIGDVVEVDAGSFEPPPPTLRGAARDLISGVYKLEQRLMLVLDTEKSVELDVN